MLKHLIFLYLVYSYTAREHKSVEKSRKFLCRPMAGQYFLMGMIAGVALGLFLIAPLHRITIETTIFKFNVSNPENVPQRENHSIEVHRHLQVNKSLADELNDKVKILCWILTGPRNHETKARHIKNTWGKRCTILLFMSTKEDPSLPAIALPVIEDRANLWGKTKEAFKYVHKHYFDKVDWFFKADDDTYVIMENMRYMLSRENTNDPLYYGCRFTPLVRQGYMSGGAGYVLSKEALRRFVNESLPYPVKCRQENTGSEDAEMGRCLEAVGVQLADTRDSEGKNRFMPVFISPLLTPGEEALPDAHWLWSYIYYPLKKGMECCSDYIISIHYVDVRTLYLFEYLIYHVKPYGLPYSSTVIDNNNTNETVIVAEKSDTDKN